MATGVGRATIQFSSGGKRIELGELYYHENTPIGLVKSVDGDTVNVVMGGVFETSGSSSFSLLDGGDLYGTYPYYTRTSTSASVPELKMQVYVCRYCGVPIELTDKKCSECGAPNNNPEKRQ